MDVWNPEQYQRFAAERSAPFDDLLALVEPRPGMRVVDLGCGSGELTARLHAQLGAADTLGLDSSAAMLERAAQHTAPGLRFELGDIGQFAALASTGKLGPCDLLFSNAALHWLDDHEALLAQLAAAIAPGGQLAVQMPANSDHPSQALAAELARSEPYAAALDGFVRSSPVLPPERYSELLHRLGFTRQRVRLEVYAHLLADREEVVEWTLGTTLTGYERRLSPEIYARFVADYQALLRRELADEQPFFYTFKRVLLWAG